MRTFRRFTPYRDRALCFLDVETTGTKPGFHEVTEIGLRHTEKGGLCLQIAPHHIERAEQEALQKSGYNTADWANAKPFDSLVPKITEYIEDATIVAHNAPFDVSMLQGEYDSACLSHDELFRDVIDTMALARIFLVPLGLNLLNLQSCMKFIGVEYEGGHNAYEDTVFCEKLYRYIIENLKWHGRNKGKRIQEGLFGDDR